MVFYHGTPIGGSQVDAAMFLTNKHGLVSFANQAHMQQVAECCSSFVLDNGAFTLWRGGKTPDWDLYYSDFVGKWAVHPGFDWHLIPDIIDGTEDDNWRLAFRYHRQARKYHGVMVYHLHESLEHLDRIVRAAEEGDFYRVAIGSSGQWKTPGTESWKARMAEIMSVVCDSDGVPRCKLHGLRQMDKDIFTLYPYSSVDSCNAGRNNGEVEERWQKGYMPPKAWQRATVIAWSAEGANSPAIWTPPPQQEFGFARV